MKSAKVSVPGHSIVSSTPQSVLRAGSTRRAAAALGISQPAVSQHVKQLETTLGITLFKRSANRIVPLQEAWELLRNVELALTSLDRLEASIFAMKHEEKQRIGIAAPSVFGFVTMPKVVAMIHAKTASDVRSIFWKLRPDRRAHLGRSRRSGDLEIAAGPTPV